MAPAAKHLHQQGLLILLLNLIYAAALEKRFSDFKRCADEECSMLLCRGKAVKDFLGPDCRFLSFKKFETVYVYYKLSGRRADLWAGSVGSNFGYFPKDLLAVNHRYTEKEHEIPAEETDFVCFDTGFDKFDNYDVDLLLTSFLEETVGNSDNETFKHAQETKSTQVEPEPSVAEVTQSEEQTELQDLEKVQEGQSIALPELDTSEEDLESNAQAVPDGAGEEKNKQTLELESVHENESETSETQDSPADSEVDSVSRGDLVNDPVSVSEERQIPELNTTLGTTFDAIASDDEITTKVTPYPEEDSDDVDDQTEDVIHVKEEVPLLTSSAETVDAAAKNSLLNHERLPNTEEDDGDKPKMTEEKNMWTSLGDAVFSVVTGGETTGDDLSSDEDEDDEDQEEEAGGKTAQIFKSEESDPVNTEQVFEDLSDNRVGQENIEEPKSDSDKLLFERSSEDEQNQEVIGHEEAQREAFESHDELLEVNQTEEDILPIDSKSQDDILTNLTNSHESTEERKDEDSDLREEEPHVQDRHVVTEEVVNGAMDTNETVTHQESAIGESETDQNQPLEERGSEGPGPKDDKVKAEEIDDHLVTDVLSNRSSAGLSVEEPDVHTQPQLEEREVEDDVEEGKEKEELLEDENALSFSESDHVSPDKPETTPPTPELEYSDSIMRLTLLRHHFTEENIKRVQRILGLKNLFKVEAMFSYLDTELQSARTSHTGTAEEVENALENILEATENSILDEIEKMLDSRDGKKDFSKNMNRSSVDEETELLDDFQELAFSLRQKYSAVSDSAPLAADESEDGRVDPPSTAEEDVLLVAEETFDSKPETDGDHNLTVTDQEETPEEIQMEQTVPEEVHAAPDVNVEEDDKPLNKNNLPGIGAVEDMQEAPQTTLENPLDVDLPAKVDRSSSGSLDPMEAVAEKHKDDVGLFMTGAVYMGCIFSIIQKKTVQWTVVVISLLPEEWRPGETLFGCPWEAVVTSIVVGVLTFTLFFWRTVLAVKKKVYLVDEKKLQEQIQALKKEKNEAVSKISQLKEQTEQLRKSQKESKETVSCTMKKMQDLESKIIDAEKRNKQMVEQSKEYSTRLEEELAASLQNKSRIEKLEKSNEKLQLSRKKIQDALAKTTVLLEEAKICEEARNAQHKCLQKDFTALKEENKTLKAKIKGWEDKHKELNEKIKVYQKSQKELEDSVVLKDHNVEVLSELLTDLDACDGEKGDTKVLANGEMAPVSLTDKKMAIKTRIRQMMDVSRVQTTLAVVEEERDRFMAKLLNEEKSRKEQEEKHQELEHEIGTLKSEKSHIENQFKVLQQKNEIMVEMYQQKENALQQRLTKEELERRSKESLLTEVGGKALEAEEQVKVLRQRINEMEEQMKKTEEVYKEQIKEQENKTHSNWVNARNAERALSQEKLEASKLREKLAVLTSQLNERRAPLFRPNSGQPGGPRQGDSYGPSPVSGGAPSPPIMIEGPRRPPSAPAGRRIDPYGPRPPSDPHGRYAENKHMPGMDAMGPRSSSPANLDGPTQDVDPQIKAAETRAVASTESPEPAPGSFMVSPIRDSPGPPPGPGVHDPLLHPGPHGRLPPPGPYRLPRPGPYQLPPNIPPPLPGPHLPPNGHPGMPPPVPIGADFGPRPANGLPFHPRPGPVMDPRGPPHFRPPPPHHFGPIPPLHAVRGPLGLRPPVHPDMRFPGPPMDPPPGVPPHFTHPGDGYGQAPTTALQNPAGGQNPQVKQEASQDSARPATVQP